MSVPTAGQPGTFLVDRPTLSFILILCTVALLGLSGEASPTRAFQIFQNVIDALESDDTEALRQTLIEISDEVSYVCDISHITHFISRME